MDLEKIKKQWNAYIDELENSDYMDIEKHTSMALQVRGLIREIERLELIVKLIEQSRDQATDTIAELMFAFINKDENFPHSFEIEAFEEALYFLQQHYERKKFNLRMFEDHLNEMSELAAN